MVKAREVLVFEEEYLSFACQSELVQSFYLASEKKKMCIGIKHGEEIRYLCDRMDDEEDLRVYPTDELVLVTY